MADTVRRACLGPTTVPRAVPSRRTGRPCCRPESTGHERATQRQPLAPPPKYSQHSPSPAAFFPPDHSRGRKRYTSPGLGRCVQSTTNFRHTWRPNTGPELRRRDRLDCKHLEPFARVGTGRRASFQFVRSAGSQGVVPVPDEQLVEPEIVGGWRSRRHLPRRRARARPSPARRIRAGTVDPGQVLVDRVGRPPQPVGDGRRGQPVGVLHLRAGPGPGRPADPGSGAAPRPRSDTGDRGRDRPTAIRAGRGRRPAANASAGCGPGRWPGAAPPGTTTPAGGRRRGTCVRASRADSTTCWKMSSAAWTSRTTAAASAVTRSRSRSST